MPSGVSEVRGSSEIESLKAEFADAKRMLKTIEDSRRQRDCTFSKGRAGSKLGQLIRTLLSMPIVLR